MSVGNFSRRFQHVEDNEESEIAEEVNGAVDSVVAWLEGEEEGEVREALRKALKTRDIRGCLVPLHLLLPSLQSITGRQLLDTEHIFKNRHQERKTGATNPLPTTCLTSLSASLLTCPTSGLRDQHLARAQVLVGLHR